MSLAVMKLSCVWCELDGRRNHVLQHFYHTVDVSTVTLCKILFFSDFICLSVCLWTVGKITMYYFYTTGLGLWNCTHTNCSLFYMYIILLFNAKLINGLIWHCLESVIISASSLPQFCDLIQGQKTVGLQQKVFMQGTQNTTSRMFNKQAIFVICQ